MHRLFYYLAMFVNKLEEEKRRPEARDRGSKPPVLQSLKKKKNENSK